MMVEAFRRVCRQPLAYRPKSASSSPHSSLSLGVPSRRFNYLLNQKKRVVKEEGVADEIETSQVSDKFNSDWDSLVDSHLIAEKTPPLYSVAEFDYRDYWHIAISFGLFFFFLIAGAGEPEGAAICGAVVICGLPLYLLGSMVFLSLKYRKQFLIGLSIPLVIMIPLSIMSYYNEIENGCISFGFPGSSGCPPDPPGYGVPRGLFFLGNFGLLIFAGLQNETNPIRTLGIVYGMILSAGIFIIVTLAGLWGF